jgi:hypothetical protein
MATQSRLRNKLAHVKTEFGFDVLEVARGRYAPDSYHDFIGFGVAIPLLEKAFQETYGLDLKDVLSDEDKLSVHIVTMSASSFPRQRVLPGV